MIAEIQDPFVGEALNRKIDYQLKKIESGVARELYNSSVILLLICIVICPLLLV